MLRMLKKGNSHINRALLKHGYSEFRLEILEYCEKDKVIEREQYYLDNLEHAYNILQIAGSNLGYKYSPESLERRREARSKKPS